MTTLTVLSAITGCLIWLPIAFWAVSLVQWWIGGEIEFLQAAFGLFVVVELGILAVAPKDPRLAPVSFAAMMIGTIAFPFVRASMAKRELRSLDQDGLAGAYEGLAQRPLDPLQRMRLARHAYALGMGGHALKIAENAVAGLNPVTFRDEHKTVIGWRNALAKHQDLFVDLPCAKCRAMVAPGNPFCTKCGAPFLLLRAGGGTSRSPFARRLFSVWLGLVAILAGIPLTSALPKPWGLVAIGLAVTAAVGMVLWAFLGGEEA